MTAIDRTTLGGARDAAFILLGYDGALRIGELAALTLDDLEPRSDGIVLRIRRSKTDRDAAGAQVAVACGANPETDPIGALQHWLQLRGPTPGSVFVPLRGGAAGERGLAPDTFGRLLKAHANEAGLSIGHLSPVTCHLADCSRSRTSRAACHSRNRWAAAYIAASFRRGDDRKHAVELENLCSGGATSLRFMRSRADTWLSIPATHQRHRWSVSAIVSSLMLTTGRTLSAVMPVTRTGAR